ncbi:hypothetical protein VSS95_28250, partial [Pseudomonas syringae pv. tagetis]
VGCWGEDCGLGWDRGWVGWAGGVGCCVWLWCGFVCVGWVGGGVVGGGWFGVGWCGVGVGVGFWGGLVVVVFVFCVVGLVVAVVVCGGGFFWGCRRGSVFS